VVFVKIGIYLSIPGVVITCSNFRNIYVKNPGDFFPISSTATVSVTITDDNFTKLGTGIRMNRNLFIEFTSSE
jgi:hypothetical protein